jgi:hypothetical protein
VIHASSTVYTVQDLANGKGWNGMRAIVIRDHFAGGSSQG